ncbi:MAG TPA: hypothetical protein VK860_14420 [Ilumatobacteraceae bacterium]|nr:hypothetical protein [Ilumatobacteraceae bacterium]
MTDDFVTLDHRQIGLGERHVDDWIESMAATTAGDGFVPIPANVLMGDGRRVLSLLAVSVGDDTWHVLTITEARDGLVSRIEHFDGDDLDAATARYRDLERQEERGHFSNTAWELGLLADATLRQGDGAGAKELFASEFVGVWHHRLADGGVVETTRDDYLAVSAEFGMADIHDRTTELLAIRGDRLALVRATNVYAAARTVAYVILESDDYQLTRLDRFDEDQRTEAIEEFDRRWLADSGVPSDAFIVAVWPSANTLQADDLSDIVHPDFEFTDHRSLRNDTDGVSFDEFARRGWTEDATWALVTEVHRFDESGTVYTRVERNGDDEIWIVFVAEQADGALRRLDLFDPDQLDAALALFDGRTRERNREGRTSSIRNRAFRIADEFGSAVIEGDRDAMLSLLADDFEIDHQGSARAALGAETLANRAEFVDLMLATAAEERAGSLTRTLVAGRGDNLYLATSTMTTLDGDEVLNFALGEADGTRLRRMTYYDESQFDEALAELDRRYRLSCGIGDDHWLAQNWSALTSSPDAEVYEALLADDFRGIEHRPVRLGETDRNVLIAYVRATPPTTAWSIPVVHRLSDRGIVFEQLETWGEGAGDTRVLMTIEFGDGVIKRLDAYEPDDLDAAVGRYDEIFGGVRRTLTNGAWDSVRRRQRALDELDVDGYASMFDESFVAEFHDLLMSAIPGTAIFDTTGFLELILHQDMTHDGARSEMELIAVRGDDLCLYLVGLINADGDLTQRLVVDETRAGLCTRMAVFGPDQFGDALAELDRRYRLSCGIGDDHWIAENWSVLYANDFAELQTVLHPQFEYVERRRLGWPNGNTDDWREWFTPDTSAHETMIPAMYRLCEHGVVTRRSERFEAGDLGVSESILVNEAEDGHVRRVISYDPDDLERALAEFDAFVAAAAPGRLLTNASWELVQRAEMVRRRGDRNGYASLLADDIVVITYDPIMAAIDNDRGAYDKERYLDALFDPMIFGPRSLTEQELVAVRGDDLCLFHVRTTTSEGDVHERLMGVEAHDGLAIRMDVFPHDRLRDAQIALDRRWLTALGFDDEDWIVRHWDLAYSMDFDDLGEMLHPDFEIFDHRPLHFPSGDAATLAETMGSIGHEVDVLIPRIHRISRSGAVVERIERAVGDVLGEEHQILVTHIVDDAIRRTDGYTVDDLPAALARYEESIRPRVRKLTNAAWELAEATMVAKARDGDRERFESVLADDFVATTHDPVMGQVDGGVFDKHRFLEIAFDPVTYAPTSTQDIELVAVRGDEICLVRTTVTSAEGDLYQRLNVVEVRDGLCVRIDAFPHDQLAEAQIALDHAWLTSLGFAHDHPWFELTELFYHSDPTVLAHAFSEEFRYVEHRRLGFPDGDRSQLLVNANTRIGTLEVVIPRYLRLTERLALGERIEQTVGGAAQMPGFYLTELGADGRIAYMEVFDVDDEEAAIACFDRLLAEERSEGSVLGPLTNAAWELVREAQLVKVNDGDRDRFASFFADEFVATTHDSIMAQADGGVFDKARYMEATFDPVFGPDSIQHIQLIAVRGDDRCLFRSRVTTPDGDLHERLNVLEVRDGLAVRIDVFRHDQLGKAQTTLDRRWLTSLDFADDHPWLAVLDWFYESDPTGMARELPDDFRSVDHRRLTYPDGDRSQIVTNLSTRLGAVEVVVPRYHRVTDRTAFFEHIEQTVGGDEQSPSLMVSQLGPDGRVVHLEIFEVDDEDGAIACFDRLLADGSSEVRGLGPLTNAAWDVVGATPALDGATGHHELIAVRADRFCLTQFTGTDPKGRAVDRLVVSDVVHGRVERSTTFEPDDLVAALRELDDEYAADMDEPEFMNWTRRMADAFDHGSFEDLRALVTDDFQSTDHRSLGLGPRTADEWATSIVPLVGHHRPVTTRIVRHDGALWLSEARPQFLLDGSEWHMMVLIRRVGHRIDCWDVFDPEQLGQALARFDELANGTRSSPALTNRAAEITSAFNAAYVAGDRVAIDRLVDLDGPVEYRQRFSVIESDTARSFVEFVLASHAEAAANRQRVEIVAVRGEHLCLVLVDGWYDDDNLKHCLVAETDDERIIHTVWFDDDQLIEAQLELDRRWRRVRRPLR